MLYIVDDAADYRFLADQVFKRFLPQYSVRLFADGMDLIQNILSEDGTVRERPHLIIMDVDMPKMSGLQTLERLKQHPLWQNIPVVMMTNREAFSYVQASYELGASSFILKPMDLDELHNTMRILCRYWLELNQLPALYQQVASDMNN